MVLYYYDKFTAISNTYPITQEYAEQWTSETYSNQNYQASGYNSYTFDKSTGKFATSGSYVTIQGSFNAGTVYSVSGNTLHRFVARLSETMLSESSCTAKLVQTGGGGTYYTKGSLVQSDIIAEDGTYPANGRHSDGNWYVKKTAVGPLLPGQVINQPYSIQGNGGRKLLRLSNGWLVSAARKDNTELFFFKSIDDGKTWTPLCSMAQGVVNTVYDFALVNNGTKVHVLIAAKASEGYYVSMETFDATTVSNTRLQSYLSKGFDTKLTALENVSLAINPTTGHLYAAWSCITSTYPNSRNIRYAKSTTGGSSWENAVNITNFNVSGTQNSTPTIVVRQDGVPVIIYPQYDGNIYNMIAKRYENGSWQESKIYSGGSFQQLNPSAVIDKKDTIHVAWQSSSGGGKYNIVYCKSLNGGSNWQLTQNVTGFDYIWTQPSLSVDNSGKVAVVYAGIDPSVSTTVDNIIARYVTDNAWTTPITVTKRTSGNAIYPSVLHDMNASGTFGTIPSLVYQIANSVEYTGTYTLNSAPTVTLTSPTDNQTLYENDKLNISGDAYDPDKDQTVTAYYQINNEPRKVLATNVSQTKISLTKQLTFKAGKLYDGDTAITGNLTDGVAHKLKVWAVDSENASSPVVERTFYVVPNRAPLISVDDVVPSGVVDNDKFKISGTATDPDDNSTIKVTRRINSGNSVEIYSGPGGAWEFDIALAQLQVGENVILVEVIDNYGAKTSKTIKLNKNDVKTPILQSVARYKIEPPKGTAKGVLLFIERDKELDLKVDLSMTLSGEQEQYETLTPEDTAPMSYDDNILEDTFYYETQEMKDNIVLKLSTTRPDATVNHKIHLISGAAE